MVGEVTYSGDLSEISLLNRLTRRQIFTEKRFSTFHKQGVVSFVVVPLLQRIKKILNPFYPFNRFKSLIKNLKTAIYKYEHKKNRILEAFTMAFVRIGLRPSC